MLWPASVMAAPMTASPANTGRRSSSRRATRRTSGRAKRKESRRAAESAMIASQFLANQSAIGWRFVPSVTASGAPPSETEADGRCGLAHVGRQLRYAPWGEPEGGSPDVDCGDHLATRIADGSGDRVEAELVLAEGGGVAAAADPGELLEERLEVGDRPLGVGVETTAD